MNRAEWRRFFFSIYWLLYQQTPGFAGTGGNQERKDKSKIFMFLLSKNGANLFKKSFDQDLPDSTLSLLRYISILELPRILFFSVLLPCTFW